MDFFGLSLKECDFTKRGGGSNETDFISEHSAKKHKYDPTKKSTKNKSQYGENMDVKKLREDTMLNPDKVTKHISDDGVHYATSYKKEYPFNISTSDTPTGSHRVFENHLDPTKSTQFPYVPRN